MPSEDDILISDLANSHPLTLSGDNTIIPIAHPDVGSDTGYATMSTTPNQIGAYTIEAQTHANLKTSNKTVEGAINQTISNIADDFSIENTYAVDDCVIYSGVLYKCIIAITTAGAWDSTKWTTVKAVDVGSGGGGGGSSTFAGLIDVSLSNLQNGQVPKYNSISGKWENANESGGSAWTDVTGTLTTGNTSITLSDNSITTSSTIEVFNDLDVPYNSKVLSTGSITLTFDAQQSDMSVKVRVS